MIKKYECFEILKISEALPCRKTIAQAKNTMMIVRIATAKLLFTPCIPIFPKIATSAAKKAERIAYSVHDMILIIGDLQQSSKNIKFSCWHDTYLHEKISNDLIKT